MKVQMNNVALVAVVVVVVVFVQGKFWKYLQMISLFCVLFTTILIVFYSDLNLSHLTTIKSSNTV